MAMEVWGWGGGSGGWQALYETGAGWELKDILALWRRRGLVTDSFRFIPEKWGQH